MATLHSVQTLVRFTYSDGKVATMVIEPDLTDLGSIEEPEEQSERLMRSQVGHLMNHLDDIGGVEGLYTNATAPPDTKKPNQEKGS